MSGRVRKDRTGSRQSQTPVSPPARRSARREVDIDPQLVPASSMPPPPTRVGRTLRSQSKEPEPQGEIARRGTRRDARERSIESVSSNFTKATGTESYMDFVQPHDLSTVVEDRADVSQVSFGVGSHPPSSIAQSEDTDTPAKKLARSRLMKTLLQRLSTASDDLRNHLVTVSDDETWQVELESYEQAFSTYQGNYAESDNFIDPAYVLSRLGASAGSHAWFTASKVISAANLASFLLDLADIDPETDDTLHCLQRWDQIFPQLFFPSKEPGRADWMSSHGTFEHALQIRTQLLIATLRKFDGPEFDPLTLVGNIFFKGGTRADDVRRYLTGEDGSVGIKSLAGIDLDGQPDDWLLERYNAQLQSLCFRLSGDQGVPNLEQLKEDHPFNVFVAQLRTWAHSCFEEIKDAMTPLHPSAMFATPEAPSRRESQFTSDAMSQPIIRAPSGSATTAAGLSQIQLLKQMEHQLAGSPPSAQEDDAITDDDVLRRRHEIQSSNYSPSQSGIAYSQASAPQNDNSVYAGSILENLVQGTGSMYAESAAGLSGTKRSRGIDDEDEFETDSRVPDNERRVAGKPKAKRTRFSGPPSSAAQEMAAQMAPSTAGSQAPEEDRLSNNPPSSYMDPDLAALSQKSREVSLASRKPREPQARVPWSREDCKLLIRAVDTYKCRWSTIEKEIQNGVIPFDHPRDQQALRDKARLLKQDFLKADGVLPPGFDLVVLGKKEKNAVILCGRNPDRQEADLDENNMPNNTVYQG